MDFDDWSRAAWDRHAAQPQEVAAQLATLGSDAVANDAQLARLANLAQHVLGEHLARWDDAVALLHTLRAHQHFDRAGESARLLPPYTASLQLAAGQADAAAVTAALGLCDRIRAQALAAAALAPHDVARAQRLFQQALADVDAAEPAALPDSGRHARTLAITGHNLACTLEERAGRSADQRDFMILAAQTARRFWALAGGWLETERAEYRLAHSWLAAGELADARHHAQLCLEIVAANGDVALERFFGWEALGKVERAAANSSGHAQALAQALAQARAAFDALDDGDRGWCQASLDQLGQSQPQSRPADPTA